MSDLQKRLQMARLPPMPPVGPGGRGGRGGQGGGKKGMGMGRRDYTPISWDKYFSNMQDVKVNNDTFRIYESGSEGPVCFLLHGGGFSALSWALFAESLVSSVNCRCVAMDMRGHGDTKTTEDYKLAADDQVSDVAEVVKNLYGESPPPIILIGHSMGGAIAVRVAAKQLIPSLIGLAVIDVVEGTALDALTSMQGFLRGRPATFRSLEHAVEWCVRSGHVRNLDSARVSMVGQVKRVDTDAPATADVVADPVPTDGEPPATSSDSCIKEEEEEEGTKTNNSSPHQDDSSIKRPADPPEKDTYTWRINLAKTEPFWRGWFEGLSQLFLASNVPKMLLLAGVDRLDKDLTVGQMQGKFQMQVLPQAGHAVHEDVPDKVADVIATFIVRHRVAEAKAGFQRTFPAC